MDQTSPAGRVYCYLARNGQHAHVYSAIAAPLARALNLRYDKQYHPKYCVILLHIALRAVPSISKCAVNQQLELPLLSPCSDVSADTCRADLTYTRAVCHPLYQLDTAHGIYISRSTAVVVSDILFAILSYATKKAL